MSSVGLLNSLLNTDVPAGSQMQIEMLPIEWIMPNPENKIYLIGDIEQLKEDIRKNGVRQPLEVVKAGDMTYKLIGGERRWTACLELLDDGDKRFSSLPCIVRDSKGEIDDKIALITANATARELTDGERLAQYEALKDALTEKKKAGQLEGKVRDALCKILSEGSGTLARLNVISSNCSDEEKKKLRCGEIGLMEAYKAAQTRIAMRNEVKPTKPQKTSISEPLPKNPDYAEWNLPPEAIERVEEAHRKNALQKSSTETASSTEPSIREDSNEKRGFSTLLQLAEKEITSASGWEFDRNLWKFQLDFYKRPLPGGAELWKLCDTQRDARGLAPGEHERYAIIYKSGDFETVGWENYNDALISLVNYFNLS